jgi:DNA polymerase-1
MEKRLFIVDGHAYAYRAFYAIRQLNSPSGAPTNAVYGFIRMLGKMMAFLQPSHITVVWDGGLAAERMQLLPEYKTHRPPMPPLLESQLDQIGRFLTASNISPFCGEGIEADDWIATVTRLAIEQDFSVVIASSDKDFMQLVSAKVGLLNPNDKEPRIWGAEEVRAKTGVEPTQIVDWLALLGDAVDNIPGVPGIGPATAAKLIQQFGSVTNLYSRLEEVASVRIREALRVASENVKRNVALVRLHDQLPGLECCDEFVVKNPDHEKLKSLYSEWGFRTLREELEKRTTVQVDLL